MARVEAVRRDFEVPVGLERAWSLLSDVQRWPEWAPHIMGVEVEPPGPVGPGSTGVLRLRRLGASAFSMTDWDAPRRWRWRGHMPGAAVDYDHRFEPVDQHITRLTWVVELDGPLAHMTRPVFARLYGANVDRAIPRLVAWFEHQSPGDTSPGADS